MFKVDVLREQRCDPACREQENDMEERVIVLRARALVVFAAAAVALVFVVGVVVVEGVGGETARFDGGAEGFGAHLAAGWGGLLVDHTVLGVV